MNFKYECQPCKYRTNVRQYYYAHNKTKKHYRKTQMLPKSKLENWECPNCNFSFKHKSSLTRHKNKCDEVVNNIDNQNITNINNINELLYENLDNNKLILSTVFM